MDSIGIIAEYNPFHNGHLHHLKQSRSVSGLDYSVCVMSGNFTQRGDAAILDKWLRAALAVRGGVDLVIELPAVFAVRSAQDFAAGALRLLDALGIVRAVCFGAEHADAAMLSEIASITTSSATLSALRQNLQAGKSYAAALSGAILTQYPKAKPVLSEPNNILAIEYIKAIKKFSCSLDPIAIQRITAHHHEAGITSSIASATAIRTQLQASRTDGSTSLMEALPPHTYTAVAEFLSPQAAFASLQQLESAILAQLRTMKLSALSATPGISEGLEYKLAAAAIKATSIRELLEKTKSKRYPLSRLQRILIHTLLRTNQAMIRKFDETGPLYARVLAFNRNGRIMLKQLKHSARIPIITKTAAYLTTTSRRSDLLSPLEKMLSIDTYATDLYALCGTEPKAGGQDFTHSPIYIDQ